MLREIREHRKLTQEDLAIVAGVDRSAISHYENGKAIPSTPVALKIARALNSTVEELFGDVSTEHNSISEEETT